MKTELIIEGWKYAEDGQSSDENSKLSLTYAKGKFFVQHGDGAKPREVAVMEAVKLFLMIYNQGESGGGDVSELIRAISMLRHEMPFAKGSKVPWRN